MSARRGLVAGYAVSGGVRRLTPHADQDERRTDIDRRLGRHR